MYRDEVMSAVYPVAADLPRLNPAPNSILAEILGSLREAPSVMDTPVDPENLSAYSEAVDRATHDSNDKMLDAMATQLAEVLTVTIDMAKTVVNPAIVSAASAAQQAVNARADEYAGNGANIESAPSSDVWRVGSLYQAVEAYATAPMNNFMSKSLFEVPEQFPVEAFYSSIPSVSISKELRASVASLGDDAGRFLTQVFANFFSNRENAAYSDFSVLFDKHKRPLMNLTALCMARALLAPSGEFVKQLSSYSQTEEGSGRVAAYASELVETMSARVFDDLSRMVRDEKANRSNVHYTQRYIGEGNAVWTAIVDQKKYNAELDNGLTPEMVLGSAISQDRAYTLEDIKANGDKYADAWARYSSTVKRTRSLKKNVVVRQCLVNAVMAEITDIDPVFLTSQVEEYQSIVEELAADVTSENADEYISNVRTLLCKAVFANTEVYDFLCFIDQVGKENPGMPPRECNRLATERLLANCLADQIVSE